MTSEKNIKIVKKLLKPRSCKKPDLHKPRFRDTKFSTRLINESLFQRWKKENPHLASKVKDLSTFKRIWKKIISKYNYYIVNNSMGVRLPFYCGDMSVEFINIEYESLDMRKSVQSETAVPHLNWNTSDKLGKLIWCIKYAAKFNKFLPFLAFKAHNDLKSATKEGLMNNPGIYKLAKT